MKRYAKEETLLDRLAPTGITTLVELVKSMRGSKPLAVMVIIGLLGISGYFLLVSKLTGA